MRRLSLPKCSNCRTGTAMYESMRWPSIKLCWPCLRDFTQGLVETGHAHENPLMGEFCEGVHEIYVHQGIKYYLVWIRSKYEHSAFTSMMIRVDSRSEVENPLDLEGDL